MLTDPTPSGMRPAMTPAMRGSLNKPFAQTGSLIFVPSFGALEIDTFDVLVDTFPIIFA